MKGNRDLLDPESGRRQLFVDARPGDRYAEARVAREGGVPRLPSHVLMPTSVVRNREGAFQMYYQTKPLGIRDFGYGGGTPVVAYAASHNGVHFVLPDLGRVHLANAPANNVLWDRTRQSFLDNTPGGFDSGLIWPSNAPVAVGDELWFYYGMGVHCHAIDYVQLPGLAKLRRDGFASMSAGEAAGWVLTEPFECPGGQLCVNADASGGELAVAVVEADGDHHPCYARVRCATIDSDAPAQRATWYERAGLDDLKGKTVRLKFYLRQADLFSFWFS